GSFYLRSRTMGIPIQALSPPPTSPVPPSPSPLPSTPSNPSSPVGSPTPPPPPPMPSEIFSRLQTFQLPPPAAASSSHTNVKLPPISEILPNLPANMPETQ